MEKFYFYLGQILEKLGKVPVKGLLLAIGVGFGIASTISLTIDYFYHPTIDKLGKAHTQDSITENQKQTISLSDKKQILKRNLFNHEGAVPDEDEATHKQVAKDQVVKSELPLELVGTIFGGDPYSGLALVQSKSKKTVNSFLVGDRIEGDAVLIEVHREKIVMQVGDHREFLELVQEDFAKGRRRKSKAAKQKPLYATDAPPDEFKEDGFERKGGAILMSKDFKQKMLTTDFAKVLQDAKAEPYFENGELSGFRLTRIKSDSIYEKAGLQNDDIVKEVNGVSLIDTAQAIRLLNSLRGEAQIEVRLMRGGQLQTINMQVR